MEQQIVVRCSSVIDASAFARIRLALAAAASEDPKKSKQDGIESLHASLQLAQIAHATILCNSDALIVACPKAACPATYKALQALQAQYGFHLPGIKQCVNLRPLNPMEQQDLFARAVTQTLIRQGNWQWWDPSKQLLLSTDHLARHRHQLQEGTSLVEAFTLRVQALVSAGSSTTINLHFTIVHAGKVRYRALDLPHLADQICNSGQRQAVNCHKAGSLRASLSSTANVQRLLQDAAALRTLNKAMPVEGVLCELLYPAGRPAVVSSFSTGPHEDKAAVWRQLQQAGFALPAAPVSSYWTHVRFSDDPDAEQVALLPGMICSTTGVTCLPTQLAEAMQFLQARVLDVLAGHVPSTLHFWGGAPLTVQEVQAVQPWASPWTAASAYCSSAATGFVTAACVPLSSVQQPPAQKLQMATNKQSHELSTAIPAQRNAAAHSCAPAARVQVGPVLAKLLAAAAEDGHNGTLGPCVPPAAPSKPPAQALAATLHAGGPRAPTLKRKGQPATQTSAGPFTAGPAGPTKTHVPATKARAKNTKTVGIDCFHQADKQDGNKQPVSRKKTAPQQQNKAALEVNAPVPHNVIAAAAATSSLIAVEAALINTPTATVDVGAQPIMTGGHTAKAPKAPKLDIDLAAVSAKILGHLAAGTDFGSVTIPEMKAYLKSVKQPVGGKKADLIARIQEHYAATSTARHGV